MVGFHEVRPDRAEQISAELGVPPLPSLEALLDQVDAVTVVVPTVGHHTVAKAALERGIHVMIEKPIATSLDEADDLVAVAKRTGALIQTGHVERFNRAIRGALPFIDTPRFIESDRLAPFNPRGSDVAVVLDLMIHDIDLVRTLVGGHVDDLQAVGVAVLTPSVDIANAGYVRFRGGREHHGESRVARTLAQDSHLSAHGISLPRPGRWDRRVLPPSHRRRLLGDREGALALEAFVERVGLDAPEGSRSAWSSRASSPRCKGARASSSPAMMDERRSRSPVESTGRSSAHCRRSPAPVVREILFVAGETSGDLHAAGVAAAIRRRDPDRPLVGIGGSRMRDAGVMLMEDVERMAVMGFVEVIRHIPRHWLLLRDVRRRLDRNQTGLVTLIDYPGFNMRVAERARARGVPVLYYITPQVWAWGAGRLAKLSRLITRAAVILPFEEPLLRQHGIDATFVGHPLLDRAKSMPDRPTGAALSECLTSSGPALFPVVGDRRSPATLKTSWPSDESSSVACPVSASSSASRRGSSSTRVPVHFPPCGAHRSRCCVRLTRRSARVGHRRSRRRWLGARSPLGIERIA